MSALQRELAKTKMDSHKNEQREETPSHLHRKWELARKAIAEGTYKPPSPMQFPVILTPNGPISSAQQLQRLAEMESLPETIETSQVDVDGDEIKKVTICHVSFEELSKMEGKANIIRGIAEGILVVSRGGEKFAMTVESLKDGVTLEEGTGGQVQG